MAKKESVLDGLVGEDAKRIIKQHKIILGKAVTSKDNGVVKYTKKKFLTVYEGYDAFENFMFVRRHLQKKYKISIRMFELVLYLYPKNYFTYNDFKLATRSFELSRIKYLIDSGFVEIAVQRSNRNGTVYTLSTKMKNMVIEFYKLLAGEKKIDTSKSPLRDSTTIDNKRLASIEKINKLEVSKTRRKFFED